ncbi:MAG: transglycosylase domain-containing protein [Deltaproteobacteria bacterium]|nr:transglycosylase domain-containing protein [Deltaproteobacteria bacterium]
MLKNKFLFLILISTTVIALTTAIAVKRPPYLDTLARSTTGQRAAILDRWKQPLRVSYAHDWNIHEQVRLSEVPQVLRDAIVTQEDQRFFQHHGIDWLARAKAIVSNLLAGKNVRGASTITEQVVRIIHPRPRTLVSKWLEGWEALWLEARHSKDEIFEFYLNQVPYSQQRRGILQAARLYFNRSLSTLNEKEILSLAVLIKSPVRLDLRNSEKRINPMIEALAVRMNVNKAISESQLQRCRELPWSLQHTDAPVSAAHFIHFVESRYAHQPQSIYETTLDPELQNFTQKLLTQSLIMARKKYEVENAAVIVADHITGDVLAWVVAENESNSAVAYDAVTVARQPGSALKPFLYGLAFERGHSATSLIEDAPSDTPIGQGLHSFKNYSRTYYGWISLREALANSLNVPAVKLVREVGLENFRNLLTSMKFESLSRPTSEYGDGLVLGNGEVSLWEMINAYSMLARMGVWQPLRVTFNEKPEHRRLLSPESSSLVGNILSDTHARRLEFGDSSIMRFPVQTALKSGTSTDYRDAWAFAYNYRYVLGIWMGNLSNKTTEGMTGSTVPMLLARGIMAKLNENQETRPLYLSPQLQLRDIAGRSGDQNTDYFTGSSLEKSPIRIEHDKSEFKLVRPTSGLHMAIDPRIPSDSQVFEFELEGAQPGLPIQWNLNGKLISQTLVPNYTWTLEKGNHRLLAKQGNKESVCDFIVK